MTRLLSLGARVHPRFFGRVAAPRARFVPNGRNWRTGAPGPFASMPAKQGGFPSRESFGQSGQGLQLAFIAPFGLKCDMSGQLRAKNVPTPQPTKLKGQLLPYSHF